VLTLALAIGTSDVRTNENISRKGAKARETFFEVTR
jgi:hypothetical protein